MEKTKVKCSSEELSGPLGEAVQLPRKGCLREEHASLRSQRAGQVAGSHT